MKKSLKVTVLATAIAAVLPTWAHAAGLGSINVFSALGQPLRAEIELHATPAELDGMRAVIAPVTAFQQANMPYSSLLNDIQLTVEGGASRPVVRVSSNRAINEPFVDLLVELSWASGRLLREYTFLLDPVETRPAQQAQPRPATVTAMTPARTAAPAQAARTPAPASVSGAATHVVREGETLHRIASAHLPPGVQLEQMLIALQQANEQAFIGGNINRLRAGVQLRIPDAASVGAIAPQSARQAVRAQAAEFNAYRNRAAAMVADAPASAAPEATRESEGVVEPRQEEMLAEADQPSDRVEVSGGAAESGAEASAAGREGAAGASEEDALAHQRALEERDQRIDTLEQTIADLQHALEISNAALARLQEQAATTSAAPPAASVAAAASEAPARQAAAPAAPPPTPQPSLLDRILGNPLLLAAGALIAGLLALLGVRIARRRREEQMFAADPESELPYDSLSVVSQPGGQSVDTDTGSSVMDSDFSQTGLAAIDADEGVDPVAEADVYLAYGRDAQAEEILLDALKVDASRYAIYLKLLEVYLQRGDRRQFEVIATDLYSRTGGEGNDWQRACSMGRKLDPDNPLYGAGGAPSEAATGWGTAAAAGAAAGAAALEEAEADEGEAAELESTELDLDLQHELKQDAPQQEPASYDSVKSEEVLLEPDAAEEQEPLEFDAGLDVPEPVASADPVAVAEADGNLLSFDLDLGDGDATPTTSLELPDVGEEAAAAQPSEADAFLAEALSESGQQDAELQADAGLAPSLEEPTYMDLEQTEFDANLLDFDLDLSPPEAEKPELPGGMDLTSIDLDLDLDALQTPAPQQEVGEAPEAPEAMAVPQFADEDLQREMDTKLELARAYEEMGDQEGARELLEDVVQDGSDEQREAATRMLERLA